MPTTPQERKRGPIPCTDCVERASALGSTESGISLCQSCLALLKVRHGPQFLPHNQSTASLGASMPFLQPRSANSIQAEDRRRKSGSSIASRRSNESQPRDTKAAIVEKVTNYSHQFVNAVNAREFDHPIWSQTSNDLYMSNFDRYAPTSTLAENIQTFQMIAANDPTYHIEVLGIDVIFDTLAKPSKGSKAMKDDEVREEDADIVHAYANQLVTGRPAGVAFDCIAVFTYMRRAGDWVLVAFNAMRYSGPSV
jgi:hypothetical protein